MPSRLSLNVMSTPDWPLEELIPGCAAAGVNHVGLWREPVAAIGVAAVTRLLREHGVRVSSLCRAGFFPSADNHARRARLEDNLRAIDEAASVGADVLVLLPGGLPPGQRDLDRARAQVAEGMAELLPHAQRRGVRLALEPLHPALCGDRSVVATLSHAVDLVESFPAETAGLMIDTFHLWWDPQIWQALERASGRILGFQVADCPRQLTDPLNGRLLPGEGVIELRRFRAAVESQGYRGPIEVEVFNRDLWTRPGPEALRRIFEAYEMSFGEVV